MRAKHCDLLSDDGEVINNMNNYLKQVYTDDTMQELHFHDNTNSSELYMYYCGISSCTPGHCWGPAIRDHFVIHYILSGKGTFKTKNGDYNLKKNQGFLLTPGDVYTYQADADDPWEYVWVGFHGLNAESYLNMAQLTKNTPTFTFTSGHRLKNCMLEMVKANNAYTYSTDIRVQSLLYALFAELIENAQQHNPTFQHTAKSQYVRKAVDYIQTNYMHPITVSELAQYVGLDRCYFSTIFKECLNIPPQKYLTQFRMNKACALLSHSDFSISRIATMTGYNDPVVFQKSFKNAIGFSPSIYRKKH